MFGFVPYHILTFCPYISSFVFNTESCIVLVLYTDMSPCILFRVA